MNLKRSFIKVLVFCFCLEEVTSITNWKRVECHAEDNVYAAVGNCHVKPLRRNAAALNVFVRRTRKSLNDLFVHLRFMKRANGWKPFLYNITVDACKFLRPGFKNPVTKFFYQFVGLATHSNLNHSCPINHDIILANHTISETLELSNNLPLPDGEYSVMTTWIVEHKPRFLLNVFFVSKE